jgi:lipopolysaccharide export system permease protein
MPYLGTMRRMGSIGRYIFRTTISAFLVILISLTAVIWVTQALHDIDLMTTQGQSILIFVGITGMIIPLLILVIAPIALLIAVVHVLNKMSTDSEIIVMNASGMSPWILFRAFLAAAVVVSILVMAVSAYFAPKGLRMLSDWLTEVHADVVGNLVQPGRFTNVGSGVTMRIRERRNNGQMVGIFLDDQRDPAQRVTVIADVGEVLNSPSGTFLVLQNGMVQRFEAKERDPTMVVFDRYAFDLSTLIPGRQAITYSIRERYLWQLLFPDPNDKLYVNEPNQFRAELHDRMIAPIYPIAFAVIAFAYLGAPRTNRQSRTISMLGAVGGVALLRLAGFVSTVFGATLPWMLALQYVALVLAFSGGLFVIHRGLILELPAFIDNWLAAIAERVMQHVATQ